MWINLVVILSTILLGLYYMQTEKIVRYKNKSVVVATRIHLDCKLYIIIISELLILQSGLRNIAVGADTYAYYEAFERVKSTSWGQIFETFKQYYQLGEGKDPGYLIFQKFIQLLVTDYQVYLILVAVLFFTSLGYFIYKNNLYITDVMFAFVLYSALFAFIRYNYVVKLSNRHKIYYIALSIALFLTPLTWVNPSTMRVMQYFSIFLLLLLPQVFNSFDIDNKALKTRIIFLTIFVLVVLSVISGWGSEYKFFWQEMQLGEN
ncbi:MAG: EpsG family protein [Paludibacter sp.]|nr:EpsG family protein [Paludibacter sp.]